MDLKDLGLHTEMITTALGEMIRRGVITGERKKINKGEHIFTFAGGVFDYALGALASKGGRGIMAFTSRTAKGYSKIKATLAPGAAVTVGRNYVDYIVTEYGIAQMRGETVKERALGLIEIAHPDFREELRRQAKENMWI